MRSRQRDKELEKGRKMVIETEERGPIHWFTPHSGQNWAKLKTGAAFHVGGRNYLSHHCCLPESASGRSWN